MADIISTVIKKKVIRDNGNIELSEHEINTPPENYSTYWIKITKTHIDFQAAALSKDIEIFSMPAGGMIHGVVMKHSTQFAGGLIQNYTLSVGIQGNLTKYASPFLVSTSPNNTNFQVSQTFFSENWGDVTSIRAQAISTGANLDASTQGDVEFFLLISQIKQ
jgi:hypothetical protein